MCTEREIAVERFEDNIKLVAERDGVPFDKFREEVRNEILISRLRERDALRGQVVELREALATFVDGFQDEELLELATKQARAILEKTKGTA